jgi:elongation factor Ts
MAKISAAEVGKLRKLTGAGMMDCKKALTEADGDFEEAKILVRERGLAIANKRSEREASEGAVIAITTEDHKLGVVICLNCETDFVAKNEEFVSFAHKIADIALETKPANLVELLATTVEGGSLEEMIIRQSGVTGEKVQLSYFDKLEAPYVDSYIHMGNKIGTIVAMNKETESEIVRNVAMQVAAMNPVAVDESRVSKEILDKEFEIGRQQAINDGKPEAIVDKIAQGKVGKFLKENTLLNQMFVRDNKITINDYLKQSDKDLTVSDFKRWALAD